MILVADSGSTKCDWRLVSEDKSFIDFKTMGINPFFHDEIIIEQELSRSPDVIKHKEDVLSIFFYGAGSSSDHYKAVVERGLKRVFLNADIFVGHDLEGAAYAAWSGEPSITCILGTGSNSCFFDGKECTEAVPALGYILGDEGSGSYFGKQVLRDFLYEKLPIEMSEGLAQDLKLNKALIFENVYQKANSNVYLASFMKFIARFRDTDYVSTMMRQGFQDFVNTHIKCYDNYQDVKTNFVGSVAFHFKDTLEEVCKKENVNIGNVIKKPIDGLVDFHFTYMPEKIRF